MRRFVAATSLMIMVGGCTPKGEIVSETECNAAIATVTDTWEAVFYSDRNRANPNNRRVVEYNRTQLVTVNGEKPANAANGPDENGVWFPARSQPPSADQLDRERQFGERVDPPEFRRVVKHTLQCSDGELTTNGEVYRRATAIFRQGDPVRVSYGLGRVLQVLNDGQPNDAVGTTQPSPSPFPNIEAPAAKERDRPVIYVDSTNGLDRGIGTATAPLKTITQALKQAKPGTIIRVQPGVYTAQSGETFPLQVGSNITLQANPTMPTSQSVQITGGGKYLSLTWAGQNTTIVAADDAQIEGLGLTNPNTRGTAIWVEKGTPTIMKNRFVGSDREGVFVAGDAAPTIQDNVFEQNGGNGLSFTRDAGGILRGNLIRKNGFGVAIGDRANPQLLNNTITANKDGLVINGAAKPTLTRNTIEANDRDGIVATMDAQPTLQANTFSGNGQYDVHNTSRYPVQVQGKNLAGLKTVGQITN